VIKIYGPLFLTVALCIAAAVSSSNAAIVAPLYPQYRLTPASPTTADSVSFWLVEGRSNSSCYPKYSTSFRITAGSGVAATIIIIKYQELMLSGIACLVLSDTVEYGPQFNFGKLPAGTCAIFDSMSGTYVKSFAVTRSSVLLNDSVTVTPAAPTTKDSLDFSLFAANLGCGGTVHNDTVTVADTCIYLSFSYEDCPACDCVSLGRWIPFHSKPLAVGTYGIYKEQSIYCAPGVACPMIAIIPEHVGQVTVHPTTAVLAGPTATSHGATVSFERSSKLLILSLPATQRVSLELYGLDGKEISAVLNNKELAAGFHALSLNKFTNARGCLIARLKSDAGESTELLAITK
jgi:hypothetical protein